MNPNKKVEKVENNSNNFFCEYCNYECFRKEHFNKHLLTSKHKKMENSKKILINPNEKVEKVENLENNKFVCICGKSYKHKSSLCAHKKTCKEIKKSGVPDKSLEITDKITKLLEKDRVIAEIMEEKDRIMAEIIQTNMELKRKIFEKL